MSEVDISKAMPRHFRLHTVERATVVLVDKDGHGAEFANCLNSFGDQDQNATDIVVALNERDADKALIAELVEALQKSRPFIQEGFEGFGDPDREGEVLKAIDAVLAKVQP